LKIINGDCIEELAKLDEDSVDSIVCDPPYAINFMGKKWDGPEGMLGQMAEGDEQRGMYAYGGSHSQGFAANDNYQFQAWCLEWGTQALRVLKPGGHILAFGSPRTYHRLASGLEDAGFEVRDCIQWLYGSGFPKSHNISKKLDKDAGKEHKTTYEPNDKNNVMGKDFGGGKTDTTYVPQTEDAKRLEGWGTALKPANEPIIMARKPFKGPVAKHAAEWGTGGLNIDASRVGNQETETSNGKGFSGSFEGGLNNQGGKKTQGRWPANVILTHNEDCELVGFVDDDYVINSFDEGAKPFGDAVGQEYTTKSSEGFTEVWNCTDDCAVMLLDNETADLKGGKAVKKKGHSKTAMFGRTAGGTDTPEPDFDYKDSGGASRFFYSAKAAPKEKNAGIEKEVENDRFKTRQCTQCKKNVPYVGSCGCENAEIEMVAPKPTKNTHPTVKPIDLMRYLIRLVTPVGGTVVDPFMGSGTTCIAASLEGFDFIGIEKDTDSFEIARERINWWSDKSGDTKQILKDNT
jgi:DNA modification methylase